jgi:hypothetical protein
MYQQKVSECQSITVSHWATATQTRMPEQQRNELEKLKRLRLQGECKRFCGRLVLGC